MTVTELIEQLKKLDGNLQVIMSSDPEGNDFRSLYQAEQEWCTSEDEPVHPDDIGTEYEESDLQQKVVLWP